MQLSRTNVKNNIILFAVLVTASLGVAYLASNIHIMAAPMMLALLVGVACILLVARDFRWGLYILLIFGVLMGFIAKILPFNFPLGVPYDALIVATFFFLIIATLRDRVEWNRLFNISTFFMVLLAVYGLLQAFNPNAVDLTGWLLSLRDHLTVLLYVVIFFVLKSQDDLKFFTKFWLALALVTGLYGVWQEIFGLTGFEWRWIYQAQNRYNLFFVLGHMRVFSFLSDPATFGLFMAYTILACLILALGPVRTAVKVMLGASILAMLLAMSYSGTRTATAVLVLGLAFFVVMTIQHRRTIFIAIGAAMMILFVMFAPIYGNRTINRIRSTFKVEGDASMNLRDQTRTSYQTYILTHPIGGGMNTTGSGGERFAAKHELAGVPPDSGYLKVALEQGWIGLLIFMSFFAYVTVKGIVVYFSLNDRWNKTLMLAYLVPFFAISIGNFTQNIMAQKAVLILLMATYVIVEKIKYIDQEISHPTP